MNEILLVVTVIVTVTVNRGHQKLLFNQERGLVGIKEDLRPKHIAVST